MTLLVPPYTSYNNISSFGRSRTSLYGVDEQNQLENNIRNGFEKKKKKCFYRQIPRGSSLALPPSPHRSRR